MAIGESRKAESEWLNEAVMNSAGNERLTDKIDGKIKAETQTGPISSDSIEDIALKYKQINSQKIDFNKIDDKDLEKMINSPAVTPDGIAIFNEALTESKNRDRRRTQDGLSRARASI